ncbi:MAG: hypothetical protein LBF51_06415 [Zoogloeaceae bacterium]|nr:hypothetical protein [Zoogloeaceae bacterium]
MEYANAPANPAKLETLLPPQGGRGRSKTAGHPEIATLLPPETCRQVTEIFAASLSLREMEDARCRIELRFRPDWPSELAAPARKDRVAPLSGLLAQAVVAEFKKQGMKGK